MNSIFSRFNFSRWVLGSWFALFATSLIIIPTQISQNYFDSLAFPHLVFLTFSALGFLVVIFSKSGFRHISPFEGLSFIFLIVCYAISIFLSGNAFSALTGDTQRFTGAISLFSFLVILIYHSNITIKQAHSLIVGICSIVTLVTILGAFQQWKFISLPGAGGAGSTLGNIDFLSAWIGTTIPLFLFLLTKKSLGKNSLLIFELVLSIYLLVALGVKQGWVDLILSSFFWVIYLIRHRIKTLNLRKKTIYWAFGLMGFLWVELVLLIPFQRTKIPLIGSDPNVQVRTQYWLAGLKIFFHSIFFGVGPDNYGNYYQQYRTLNSVLREELVTSNDAHSALFQTLSTLGIFGSLAFLVVFLLLVRALVINYGRYPSHRKLFYFLAVFFVIYSTNAMISPITLPHKFIFWALVGLVLGLASKPRVDIPSVEKFEELSDQFSLITTFEYLNSLSTEKVLKPLITLVIAISVVVVSLLSVAQFRLIESINNLQNNPKSQTVINYQHSSYFPCTYYYLTEQTLANQVSLNKVVAFAKEEVNTNPRCIDAHLTLAKIYFAQNDAAHLGWEVKALMEMAPANRSVLTFIGDLATKLGDKGLISDLHDQEVKLKWVK